MSLLKPRYIVPYLRLNRYLRSYPIYSLPYSQMENTLPDHKSMMNYDFFIDNKIERMEFCQKWLEVCFNLNILSDGQRISGIEKWINVYGGLLVPNRIDSFNSYRSYYPPWRDKIIGLNVIFDIGIIIGEWIINKNPSFRWEIYNVDPKTQITENKELYRKPALFYKNVYVFDVLSVPFFCCYNFHQTIFLGSNDNPNSDQISEFVSYAFRLAEINETTSD